MSLINKHIIFSSTADPAIPFGSVDVRMIAVMRCILAFSGLVITYIDPTQPAIFSALTYSSLVAYGIWSFVLVIAAFRRDPAARPPRDTHWGDVLFCAYLVTLTQGTNSLFFSFFLFAILSASFSRGFQEGLLVTGASVILFALASVWFEPGTKFGFDQTLVRPIYLMTLGYMISYWGGHEITQRRRMNMLQEVNNQVNPRLGYDDAIRFNLERILNFFEAKACILVLKRPTTPPTYLSYYTSNHLRGHTAQVESIKPDSAPPPESNPNLINEDTARILLSLPVSFSALYERNPAWLKRHLPGISARPQDAFMASECAALANLLDTQNFLTVPYIQQDGSAGRIFLIPGKKEFSQSDVGFVTQMVTSISRVVESMHLMDELVSESAKHERFRISLDIHDTTIQPYIGIKLGLDALHRKAGTDNPLNKDIGELLSITESTIYDLRRYVTMLREDKVLAGDSLVASIKEQAERFKRFYGIDVQVKCDSEVRVNSQLAGSVIQIIAEGLSNILRHTKTRNAYISLRCEEQKLLIEIANESSESDRLTESFTPRSINARARTLGGTSFVNCDTQGYTVVHVNIPL